MIAGAAMYLLAGQTFLQAPSEWYQETYLSDGRMSARESYFYKQYLRWCGQTPQKVRASDSSTRCRDFFLGLETTLFHVQSRTDI